MASTSTSNMSSNHSPRKSGRALRIVGILLVLGVVGIAGVWYFVFRKNPESVKYIDEVNQKQELLNEATPGWDDEDVK